MNNQAAEQSRPSENAPFFHPKTKSRVHDAAADTKLEADEADEASLEAEDLTQQPSSTHSKASGVAKPKTGNTIWRKLERRSSAAGGRDRSIVSAGPLDNNDDNAVSTRGSLSGHGGDGPRLLTDSDQANVSSEHEVFLFNMNGSRYSGIDLFDFEDSSSDDDDDCNDDDSGDEDEAEDGPKLIEGSAGSRIRVVLGATGQSFLLLIDEDDGTKQWQSKSWYGIPEGLAEKLKDVEYVHQCSYSSNGIDWFLKARSAKTGTTRSWWSVQSPAFHTAIAAAIEGGLEVRVVFGSASHDQYIVLLGPNGYTLGSHLPEGILAAMDQIYDAETTIARIRGLNAEGRFLVEELIDEDSDSEDGKNESQSVGVGIIRSVYHAKGLSPHLQRALETFVENQEIIWEISIGIDDSSWLIIRDDAWDGSVAIHDELALLLDRFYSRHAKRLEEQANRVSVMAEEKRLREQQRLLAAAEERRKNSTNNSNNGWKPEIPIPVRPKRTSNPKISSHVLAKKKEKRGLPAKEKERRQREAVKVMKERQARRHENTLEQCRVAGKRREKEDRLHELAWKELVAGDPVTVLGVSTKVGDVRIVDIDHTSGVVRIQLPHGLAKKKTRKDENASVSSRASRSADPPVIPIHDTRRLTKYDIRADALTGSKDLASLVLAADKYEAAVMLYHSYCESRSCACKRQFYGYSQSDVHCKQLKLGDRVRVIGYADATIIRSSEDYVHKPNLIHVQYDDQSTYHVNASQLRPIQSFLEDDNCRFLEPQTPAEERALRIRPFYDALTPKNEEIMYRFDEYTCREKIDLRRLQSLADELRRDSALRLRMLADFQKQVEVHTESSKFEVCYNTLEKCRDLEETVYSLFEMLKGFPCDDDGHLQHEVQYRHKDVGQRGRLFAVGRSVRILRDAFPRTLTLQGIQGELIGPLTGSFCHYVDCVNSDIQLLCSLGKQMGVESMIPTINDYRNFRDKWLEAIHQEHPDTSPDEVKRLVNIILFGGTYDSWLKQVGEDPVSKVKRFTFRLYAETRAIRDQLLNHPRFQWVEQERHELEQKGLTGESLKMVLFERILHSCENVVLGLLHRTFHNNGWRVRAKLFDALLVERGPMVEHDLDRTIAFAQQSCSSMGWEVMLIEKPLFGRHHVPLGTIVDARTIVGAVQAAAAGHATSDFWAEASMSHNSSTNDT